MSITYKDIDTYTQKSSVAGTEKIPVSSTEYITPNQITSALTKGNGRLFYGTCDTAGATADKVVSCSAFSSTDLENGSVILVKFGYVNSATTSDLTLNVNNTGAISIRTIRDETISSLKNTGAIRAQCHLFVLSKHENETRWLLVGEDIDDTNTTYSSMTQAEIDAGTGTTGRRITPKLLRDNFYTETEVDVFFTNRPTIVHLSDESDMPATPDANTIYMIDE